MSMIVFAAAHQTVCLEQESEPETISFSEKNAFLLHEMAVEEAVACAFFDQYYLKMYHLSCILIAY